MKIDASMIQSAAAFVAALAALAGALYGVITRPLLKRMDDIRADILDFKKEVRAEFNKIDTDLIAIRTELKVHGERLARVEERLPPPLVHR